MLLLSSSVSNTIASCGVSYGSSRHFSQFARVTRGSQRASRTSIRLPSAVAKPYDRPGGSSSGARGNAGATPAAPPAPAPALAAAMVEAPAASSGLFGAVALITGSTIGAGMLALPAVTAPAGIVPTSVALVACWALLTLDALLLAGGCRMRGASVVRYDLCVPMGAAAACVHHVRARR